MESCTERGICFEKQRKVPFSNVKWCSQTKNSLVAIENNFFSLGKQKREMQHHKKRVFVGGAQCQAFNRLLMLSIDFTADSNALLC